MLIVLTSGIGKGETEKSALDLALHQAGIAHYNHSLLTSVIPFGAHIVSGVHILDVLHSNFSLLLEEYGAIVHSVMSYMIAFNKPVSAGIAISPNEYSPFIIEAKGADSEEVSKELQKGVADMLYYRLINISACWRLDEDVEELTKKARESAIYKVVSGYNKGKYNAAVSAAVFITSERLSKKILETSHKSVAKVPDKPKYAPAGI